MKQKEASKNRSGTLGSGSELNHSHAFLYLGDHGLKSLDLRSFSNFSYKLRHFEGLKKKITVEYVLYQSHSKYPPIKRIEEEKRKDQCWLLVKTLPLPIFHSLCVQWLPWPTSSCCRKVAQNMCRGIREALWPHLPFTKECVF